MERPRLGWRAHDDLHAAIGRVVLSGAFFAVHVAERIGIGLHELVVGDELGEMGFPELLRALQVQTLVIMII